MFSSEIIRNLASLGNIPGTATFSPDFKYRYLLTRKWSEGNKICNFVLCNPSTADAKKLDPTVLKCLQWAIEWGYDELVVTNIFAFRSTDPAKLIAVPDPVGPENNEYIAEIFEKCNDGLIVAGWGTMGKLFNRGEQILNLAQSMKKSLSCLRVGVHGHPWHPLYLPKASKPEVWRNYE